MYHLTVFSHSLSSEKRYILLTYFYESQYLSPAILVRRIYSLIKHPQSFVEVPRVVLEEHLKIFSTQVTAGNSIELKCDIKGGETIIWKRNGASLEQVTTNDIKVSDVNVMLIFFPSCDENMITTALAGDDSRH